MTKQLASWTAQTLVFGTISALMLFLVFAFTLGPSEALAASSDDFVATSVVSGLFIPTAFTFAPDGRIFFAEKGGRVRIARDGVLLPTPFIELSDVNDFSDRGLIGLTLDPDFANNGWVYLSYTYENNPADYEGPKTGRIVRVRAEGDVADMDTYEVLVGTVAGTPETPSCEQYPAGSDCIPSDADSHSVGGLRFGPDGMLYATLGDGSSYKFADPLALRAQNLDSLAGKLLRLNPDGSAPADNPFYTGNPHDNRSKVYNYGLRNSFRFSFNPTTGAPYLGNVGWFSWEEINVGVAGGNYGWPCHEGTQDMTQFNCTAENAIDPLYAYPHDASGRASITGGVFYTGTVYPEAYRNKFYFADFIFDTMSYLTVDAEDQFISVSDFIPAHKAVAIEQGPDGHLYYLAIYDGELRRIEYIGDVGGEGGDFAPSYNTATIAPTAPVANEALTITSSVSNSGDSGTGWLMTVIYDESGNLKEDVQEVALGSGASNSYTTTWTPEHAGTYYVDAGLFSADWSEMYQWAWRAGTVVVGEPNTGGNEPFAVNVETVAAQAGAPGELLPVSTTIKNSGEAGNANVLVIVYDDAGTVYEHALSEDFAVGETRILSDAWIPESAGTYYIDIGLFSPDWSEMYQWAWRKATVLVSDGTGGGEPGGTFAPRTTITTVTPEQATQDVTPGQALTITSNVTNNGDSGTGWLMTVIYDESGNLKEDVQEVALGSGASNSYTTTWTPEHAGTYYVDAGLFSADWSEMYQWAWRAGTVVVDWPTYTRAEVAEHHDSRTSCWVVVDDLVFDLTEMSKKHPGAFTCGGDSSANYHQNHGPVIRAQMLALQIGTVEEGDGTGGGGTGGGDGDDGPAPYAELYVEAGSWDDRELMVVVEKDAEKLLFIDGTTHTPVGRVHDVGFQPHTSVFSQDARYMYIIARDGWLTKLDLSTLAPLATVKVGENSRGTALTEDGRYLAIGNYQPGNVVILDANTMEILKTIPTVGTLNGVEVESRVGGLVQKGNIILATLNDLNSVWAIDTSDPTFPVVHEYWGIGGNQTPLHDAYLTLDGVHLLVSVMGANTVWVLNTDTWQVVGEVPTGMTPHTGPGATWGTTTYVPALGEGLITAIDTNTWEPIAYIETGGPGLFIRAYPNNSSYPYVWADTALGDHRDEIYVIDARTNTITETLIPVPGESSWHPEFTLNGDYVYVVSQTGNEVTVYDAHDFTVVTRISAQTPSAVSNVGLRTEEPGL